MHQYVDSSNDLLHKRGYRLTPQRYLVLSVIQEANGHISLEQIAERVQALNPRVSLSTIYRTLELLNELGLIHENHLPGEPLHYEMPQGNNHHHLVCKKCKTMIHLDDALLGDLPERMQKQYRFHNLSLGLLAAGYCDSCWQQMQQEAEHLLQETDAQQ